MAEDSAPLMAGTAVHASLAKWFTSRGDASAALLTLRESYQTWADEHVPSPADRLSFNNVYRVMERWFDVHPLSSWVVRVDPALVEVGFAAPVAEDIVFVGRADAVGQDAHGAYLLVEHKSSGRLDERWRRQHRLSAQVTGYTWAMQQHTNLPVVGALVNGIELSKLPDAPRKCRVHGVQYSECGPFHAKFEAFTTQRTPEQHAEWQKTVVMLARRFMDLKNHVKGIDDIKKVRTNGAFSGACANCSFADYCNLGRPTDARTVDAMFTYAPWSPYEHAFGGHKLTE